MIKGIFDKYREGQLRPPQQAPQLRKPAGYKSVNASSIMTPLNE